MLHCSEGPQLIDDEVDRHRHDDGEDLGPVLEYWSQIFAIIVTMPINFVVNKLWTFRAVKHSGELPMVASAVVPESYDDGDAAESR